MDDVRRLFRLPTHFPPCWDSRISWVPDGNVLLHYVHSGLQIWRPLTDILGLFVGRRSLIDADVICLPPPVRHACKSFEPSLGRQRCPNGVAGKTDIDCQTQDFVARSQRVFSLFMNLM